MSAVGQAFVAPAARDNTQILSGFLGMFLQSDPALSVDEQPAIPLTFALLQNYPNPFNPKTVVSSQLPVASDVKITIYDLLGREVVVLVNEKRDPGRYQDSFDASALASGMYVYRMTAGSFVATRRMLLLK